MYVFRYSKIHPRPYMISYLILHKIYRKENTFMAQFSFNGDNIVLSGGKK